MYTTAAHSKTITQSTALDAPYRNIHELYMEAEGEYFRSMAGATPQFASELAARIVSKGQPQPNLTRWQLAKMNIKVRLLEGSVIVVSIDPRDPVSRIKELIEDTGRLSAECLLLLKFQGSWIHNGRKAWDYGIEDGAKIDVRCLARWR